MKNIMLSLLIVLSTNVFAQIGDTPYTLAIKDGTANLNATPHDNDVYFRYGDGVNSMGFDFISQEVTPGQQFSTGFWKYNVEGSSLHIDLWQGRHNSSDIANDFNKSVDLDKSHIFAPGGYGNFLVHEMNFFVVTKMRINGSPVSEPVLFGQAGVGSMNLWYMASRTFKYNGKVPQAVNFVTEDNKSYCVSDSGGVNAFKISKGFCTGVVSNY